MVIFRKGAYRTRNYVDIVGEFENSGWKHAEWNAPGWDSSRRELVFRGIGSPHPPDNPTGRYSYQVRLTVKEAVSLLNLLGEQAVDEIPHDLRLELAGNTAALHRLLLTAAG